MRLWLTRDRKGDRYYNLSKAKPYLSDSGDVWFFQSDAEGLAFSPAEFRRYFSGVALSPGAGPIRVKMKTPAVLEKL